MTTVGRIIERASILLNDEDHTRWPVPELVDWLNEGVSAIILAKPSASAKTIVIPLVAGTRQSLPDLDPPPLKLERVVANVTATDQVVTARGRIITPVSRASLDADTPLWHDKTVVRQRKEVRHIVFDDENPLTFWTYPGNDGTGKIEAVVSFKPAPIDNTETEAAAYDAVDVPLPDPYEVPLLDYVLYRAFLKDDLAGQTPRAAASLGAFGQAIGLKIQVEAATSPNTRRA